LPAEAKLEVRAGIATGVIVVVIGRVWGETPNLAQRLEGLNESGSIVIADSTKKLIGDFFACRDMGTVAVKGYSEPMQAWQVLVLSQVESRVEALRSHELTTLVGREEELQFGSAGGRRGRTRRGVRCAHFRRARHQQIPPYRLVCGADCH
jgi:hypothetical protein